MQEKPIDPDEEIHAQNVTIKNLVFSGGGAKGATYPGAYEALCEEKIMPNIKNISGSSAGAITAALIATGATSEKFKKLSEDTRC